MGVEGLYTALEVVSLLISVAFENFSLSFIVIEDKEKVVVVLGLCKK